MGSAETPYNKDPNPERFGRDVHLFIELARHGKKDSHNAMRITNAAETAEIASNKDLSRYDLVAIRTTPVERAVDTALYVQGGYEGNETVEHDTVNVRVRESQAPILSAGKTNIGEIMKDTDVSKDVSYISPKLRQEYKEATEKAVDSSFDVETAGVEVFLANMRSDMDVLGGVISDLENGRELSNESLLELETFVRNQKLEGGKSILELVLRMNRQLEHYINVTSRLKSKSNTFIHEVSHSGIIEPFIAYLIGKQIEENPVDESGHNIISLMGGAFKPNESMGISINRDDKESSVEIIIELRGKSFPVTYDPDANNTITLGLKLLDLIE
jgi:hypothetical protein